MRTIDLGANYHWSTIHGGQGDATGVTRIDADPPEGSFIYEDNVEAELLISGTPNHHGLTMMRSDDGRVACGVWGCGVYKERIPHWGGMKMHRA